MQTVLLIIRLALAGVFAVAGFAKFVDRRGCREMLLAFGVPGALANPLAPLLPAVELCVAATLLPVASAWFAAMAALFLFVLFIGAIAFNLSRGRKPECNCFGQIHPAPIGWSTLVRNMALAAPAAFMIWHGRQVGPSVLGWMGNLSAGQRVTALLDCAAVGLLALGTALLVQLVRQQGRILLRLDGVETRLAGGVRDPTASSTQTATGLEIGTRAPGFRLDALGGGSQTLESLLSARKAAVLLFTNPNCGPCSALMPEVGDWQREHAAWLSIALVSEGTAEDNGPKSVMHELDHVLLQQKREVADNYQAWGTPAAVLVRVDGTIGSFVAQGAEAIRTLVKQALAEARSPVKPQELSRQNGHLANGGHAAASRPAAKIGDPAPPLDLLDVSGKRVGLKELLAGDVLLLFWNPACGYCQQMLNELKVWEKDPPAGAASLVLISTGTVEDNRALQLASPVMIDDTLGAGPAFGAHGTPMGVLIDSDGRIASEVAAGARAVFALANAGLEEAVLLRERSS
jgi:peroxiredoxin/uncharacterized membrane protein YphA (DoxX/SURF4 family)